MANKVYIFDKLNVSRETINDLQIFKDILLKKNKKLNLISKNDEKIIDLRHIYDSAQVIDMFNKNIKKCSDLGTGSGFPGIVLSILAKHKNIKTNFLLYEKSYRKSEFLVEIINKLKLDASVINKNILELRNLQSEIIIARAFKPIDQIFEILNKNFFYYKNLILFLGKKGKQTLIDASKVWDFEYKERKSLTSDDSLILNIKNLKKKIE